MARRTRAYDLKPARVIALCLPLLHLVVHLVSINNAASNAHSHSRIIPSLYTSRTLKSTLLVGSSRYLSEGVIFGQLLE